MNIRLWMIGKTDNLYQPIEDMFAKRLKHYTKFSTQIFNEQSTKNRKPEIVKKLEAELITAKLNPGDYLILLDEKGTEFTSRQFALKLEKLMVNGTGNVIFLIGGAFGFDEKLKQRANAMFALSKLTYSHQIIRTLFLEQLYRAFTIINNQPYHND